MIIAHISNLIGCATNYHHNYSVSGAFRTYYGGVPDMIQVSEHQFIHKKVLNLFIGLMLFSWCVHRDSDCKSNSMLTAYWLGHPQQMLRGYIISASVIPSTTQTIAITRLLGQMLLLRIHHYCVQNMCGMGLRFLLSLKITARKEIFFLFLIREIKTSGLTKLWLHEITLWASQVSLNGVISAISAVEYGQVKTASSRVRNMLFTIIGDI
jgi:hypothetical protein